MGSRRGRRRRGRSSRRAFLRRQCRASEREDRRNGRHRGNGRPQILLGRRIRRRGSRRVRRGGKGRRISRGGGKRRGGGRLGRDGRGSPACTAWSARAEGQSAARRGHRRRRWDRRWLVCGRTEGRLGRRGGERARREGRSRGAPGSTERRLRIREKRRQPRALNRSTWRWRGRARLALGARSERNGCGARDEGALRRRLRGAQRRDLGGARGVEPRRAHREWRRQRSGARHRGSDGRGLRLRCGRSCLPRERHASLCVEDRLIACRMREAIARSLVGERAQPIALRGCPELRLDPSALEHGARWLSGIDLSGDRRIRLELERGARGGGRHEPHPTRSVVVVRGALAAASLGHS